jgi:vacuolar protein sorting-associated protein 13A/C
MPFKLLFGRIGKLEIQIPWKSNFSAPTVINIDTIQILISLVPQEEWEFLDYISYEAKLNFLNKFVQERILELTEAFQTESQKSSSYSDRVMLKILDNLHVNFKNIHLRIEEPHKSPFYCIGVTLNEMLVVNTNENWEQKFIDRNKNKNISVFKLLKITNFGIYLKTSDNIFISNGSNYKPDMDLLYNVDKHICNLEYLVKPSKIS